MDIVPESVEQRPPTKIGGTQHRKYRCVCGESFDIEPAVGRTCPRCRRHYDPEVFLARLADTMSFSGRESDGAQPQDSAEQADSLIGTCLGHFRIVSRLGEGGMGRVYQAVDESLQRYVALKVIRQPVDGRLSHIDQLVQEARAQARVNHPNVAHIYYVGESGGSPFFAMELIPGKTLAQRVAEGAVPFGTVVRIGLQVASALERAAQFDIVHGDVKPSNILEADLQTIKISDFGLSRRLSASSAENERMAGTPNYLSPEIIRGETPDARSDIYSLGVTLFELTFGQLPIQLSGQTLQERLDAHLTQAPKFPDPWPAAIPEGWRSVLQRMMAKHPADRYQNYAELRADLFRLLPRRRIRAARTTRCIAWFLDASALVFIVTLLVLPSILLSALDVAQTMDFWKWISALIGTGLAGLILLAVVFVQCRWGATPGKMILQLAIVDDHGVRPRRKVLAARALMQFPWLVYFFSPLVAALGLDLIDSVLSTCIVLVTLVSAALLLFRRDQRTLHDWLLKTHVIVQTGEA